jgi:hypothetical protein
MDEYNRKNLEFLLNADKETLLEWYNSVGEDDHEYASELMLEYSEELAAKNILISDIEITDISEAAHLIGMFRL